MKFVPGIGVKFVGKEGHQAEILEAHKHLKTDIEYNVNFINSFGPDRDFLFLDGVPGNGFNSVMFEPAGNKCTSH